MIVAHEPAALTWRPRPQAADLALATLPFVEKAHAALPPAFTLRGAGGELVADPRTLGIPNEQARIAPCRA